MKKQASVVKQPRSYAGHLFLRDFKESDMDHLTSMEADYYREVDTTEEFSPARFRQEMLNARDDPRHRLFIAEVGEDIAGFLHIQEYDEADGKLGYINNIHVLKAYRGRGIAKRLLSEAETHFRSRNVRRLQLEVVENNASALGLYVKSGYKLTRYHQDKNEYTPAGEYLEKELT